MGYQWRETAPKWNTYPDKGCHLAPSCIECPFKICWEDLSNKTKRKLKGTEEIKEFLLNG